MVTLLEELNYLKRYKEETFYLALSIADRYLVKVTVAQTAASPCLITLAVVATLIAAKIEQPLSPSFLRMAHLVKEEWGVDVSKKELIDLEDQVLLNLDFELHYVSPLPFLERFLRLYNLDLSPKQAECAPQILKLARKFMRTFVREAASLQFKPSQVALSALILALNVSLSPLGPKIGCQNVDTLRRILHFLRKDSQK